MPPEQQRIIRFGIIGTGRIAGDFASDLKLVENTALQAVLSREMAAALTFKSQHGATQAYDSMVEFMADPQIDAVYIASPNSAHLAQARAAIRARKAVLIEKPLVLTGAEADLVGIEAANAGVFAMEAMWIRFLPGVLKAKALIGSGAIGAVTGVSGELSYQNQYDPQKRMFNQALGGGASLDLGVYLLSLTTFLFGLPKSVEGSWQAAASGVDEAARYQMNYPQFHAHLSTSIVKNGGNVFEISGEKGVLRIENPFIKAKDLRLIRGLAARLPLTRPRFDRSANILQKLAMRLPLPGQQIFKHLYPGNGLQFEIAAAADAIRWGSTQCESAPLSESAAVLRMIEGVLTAPATN